MPRHKSAGALQSAIEIELKGKEFYTQARDRARHTLGRQIFAHLVEEEDGHLKRIREVFEALPAKGSWPKSATAKSRGEKPAALFQRLIKEQKKHLKGGEDDLQALETALGLEEKNEKLYRDQAGQTRESGEREFFERLADERRHPVFDRSGNLVPGKAKKSFGWGLIRSRGQAS